MQCTSSGCGVMCHKKCEKNMPNLCGINEKVLAAAMKDVSEEKKRRRSVSLVLYVCVSTYIRTLLLL